jgi:hypothetical protein
MHVNKNNLKNSTHKKAEGLILRIYFRSSLKWLKSSLFIPKKAGEVN